MCFHISLLYKKAKTILFHFMPLKYEYGKRRWLKKFVFQHVSEIPTLKWIIVYKTKVTPLYAIYHDFLLFLLCLKKYILTMI